MRPSLEGCLKHFFLLLIGFICWCRESQTYPGWGPLSPFPLQFCDSVVSSRVHGHRPRSRSDCLVESSIAHHPTPSPGLCWLCFLACWDLRSHEQIRTLEHTRTSCVALAALRRGRAESSPTRPLLTLLTLHVYRLCREALLNLSDQAESSAACGENLTARGIHDHVGAQAACQSPSASQASYTRKCARPYTCTHATEPLCSLLILPPTHCALPSWRFPRFIRACCLGEHLPSGCAQCTPAQWINEQRLALRTGVRATGLQSPVSLAGSCRCSKLKLTPQHRLCLGFAGWGGGVRVLPCFPTAPQQPGSTNTRPALDLFASFVGSRAQYCLLRFNCREAWATLTPTCCSLHLRASVAVQLGSLIILWRIILNILPGIHSEVGTPEVMMVFSKLFDKFIRPRKYVQG